MLSQGQVGPISSTADGVQVALRAGKLGDQIVSELHPRYYETTYRGSSFILSLYGAAAVAFSGGSTTPFMALYNPIGSGKNAVITKVAVSNNVAASAAGTCLFALWFGQTAVITGTTTVPYNTLTQAQSGSAMTCFKNAALTGATTATNLVPLSSYYWATAAGAAQVSGPAVIDLEGSVIIPPGSWCGLGGNAALTSATWSSSLQWEEVPV